MKLKTIFMGTPQIVYPALEVLYRESKLVCILTGPDRVGGRGKKTIIPKPKEYASTHNIPLLQPKTLKNESLANQIEAFTPDLLVVYAYGFILPKKILDIPKLAPINLHSSLLPKYRGASPIQSVLLNGEKETGVTAQIMTEKLDEGDIIHVLKTKIEEQDDFNSLSYRLSLLSASCLREVINLYKDNKTNPISQNHSEATLCKKIKKEDGIINWEDSSETISNKIKAYIHWPQCFTYYDNIRVILHKIESVNNSIDYPPGTIIQADKNDGILIQCKTGIIKILVLQPQNKKPMDYRTFLNGYSWKIKKRLTSFPKK